MSRLPCRDSQRPDAVNHTRISGGNTMHGASIVREDGTRGTVVAEESPEQLIVEFADGARFVVAVEALVRQQDGSYRLPLDPARLAAGSAADEVVIPVVAEELTVETYRVARSRVRVHKRVEVREEVVDTPTVIEEVVVERIPVNRLIDDADEVPTAREEGDVTVIPVIEEVLVVHKQLMVREEVRMFKRSKTVPASQTVVLRREVVDIHREALSDSEPRVSEEASTGKEPRP
jgi:uncharacterized protein (TIGR02271 family)